MLTTPPSKAMRAEMSGDSHMIDHQKLVRSLIRRKQSYLVPDSDEECSEVALGISVDSQTTLFQGGSDWGSDSDDSTNNVHGK